MPDESFSSYDLIGSTVYAALRPFGFPGGRICKKFVSKELVHAMLFVERVGSPDTLLRYELGKKRGSALKMDEVPRSQLPPNAIAQPVFQWTMVNLSSEVHVRRRVLRVCDVTRKAKEFEASQYNLLEGIQRRFGFVHISQRKLTNNCQTFVDYMFYWLTGVLNGVTHKLLTSSSSPLLGSRHHLHCFAACAARMQRSCQRHRYSSQVCKYSFTLFYICGTAFNSTSGYCHSSFDH